MGSSPIAGIHEKAIDKASSQCLSLFWIRDKSRIYATAGCSLEQLYEVWKQIMERLKKLEKGKGCGTVYRESNPRIVCKVIE